LPFSRYDAPRIRFKALELEMAYLWGKPQEGPLDEPEEYAPLTPEPLAEMEADWKGVL